MNSSVTANPAEPAAGDAGRVARLAAYDDALAAGADTRAPRDTQAGPPADDLALLRLLDQLRPAHPAPPPTTLHPGARHVLRRLPPPGGIGEVWLAHDTELGRDVALKVLRPERAGDPALAARFLHEARITGRLQHPGIVPVYELEPDDGPDDQPPFYTMRLVQGRTLTEAVR